MWCRGWRQAAPVLTLASPVLRQPSAMRTAKPWIKCLFATICVSRVVGAAPLEGPLTLLIYDRAHVGSKTLIQAERLASEIFAGAGIEAQWTSRSVPDSGSLLNDFSAATGQACAQPLDSTTLRVEILPHALRRFSPQALGYAPRAGCRSRSMGIESKQ
jgi:hypothetical protein